MKSSFNSYYAVIFTSKRLENTEGYNEMSEKMTQLAHQQKGFIGKDSANEDIGITVSYWKDLESIKAWKENFDHAIAIKNGKSNWYSFYNVKIAKVEREYEFNREEKLFTTE